MHPWNHTVVMPIHQSGTHRHVYGCYLLRKWVKRQRYYYSDGTKMWNGCQFWANIISSLKMTAHLVMIPWTSSTNCMPLHGCGLSPAVPCQLLYNDCTPFHDPMDFIDQLYAYQEGILPSATISLSSSLVWTHVLLGHIICLYRFNFVSIYNFLSCQLSYNDSTPCHDPMDFIDQLYAFAWMLIIPCSPMSAVV